ncbi:hypothetical protein RB614_43330 [Phytohabitans sp. ZYX-F-186]|uniref:PPE family domain-containing protein n=1 Tax=Phytohabitans maris TaxID=3071409 RepID=A0ABU0ZWD5_9ACTN|nr:hypothetical protein [Phytohabitans sp. ZYX-F-186]MDQ7911344.1 hypothetical protein [Phytohabitans sp. ZYX-F-186]
MWRLLENQQSDDHWRLVAGWRKASELTGTHLRRLEQYRTNLAEVWPPDRNAAAAAYVARLDFLIQNVRTTHDVTAANYSTLAATVGALASARHDLKPLYDEYLATSRTMKEYAELAAFNAAAEAPTVIGAPPVGPQDLERLNNRARAIMYTLSHTLVEAEAAIRQPPTYPTRGLSSPVDPDVYGDDNGANAKVTSPYQATLSDPVERYSASGVASTVDRLGSDTSSRGFPTVTPTPVRTDSGQWSTVLPIPNSEPRRESGNVTGTAISSRTAKVGSHVLPAGGVIGPIPAAGKSPLPRAAARINPFGGVIDNHHLSGPVVSNNDAQPGYGAFGGAPREQQRRAISRRPPDTTWAVPEGVDPIITPSQRVGDFDPGPTIGLDR